MVKKRLAPFAITPTPKTLEKHTAHCHPSTKTHFFPSTITTHPFFKESISTYPVFLLEILCLKKSLKLTNLRTETERTGGVSIEDTTMGLQRDDWSFKCWNFRSGWRLSTWLHRRSFFSRGVILKLFPKGGGWFQRFFFLTPDPWGNDPIWRSYFSDEQWSKPWLFRVHRGLYYPVILGLFHKPWNKDPYQPINIMECQQGLFHVAQMGWGWNQQLVIIWIYNPHTKDATNEGAERLVWWGFFSLWIPWAWNGEGWPRIDSYEINPQIAYGRWYLGGDFSMCFDFSLGKNRTRSKQVTQLKIRLAVGHTAPILDPQEKVTILLL